MISLILSFFVFTIIYASIVIAYLVINPLMPDVDVYTEAVVISICILAELHARAKRARGRSPIAKVIYPSQKIW